MWQLFRLGLAQGSRGYYRKTVQNSTPVSENNKIKVFITSIFNRFRFNIRFVKTPPYP